MNSISDISILKQTANEAFEQSVEKSNNHFLNFIPFMKDGSTVRKEHKKSATTLPLITNTSALDSFYHIIACVMKRSDQYKQFLYSLNDEILDFISDILDHYIDNESDLFETRAKIIITKKFLKHGRSAKRQSGDDPTHYKKSDTVQADVNVISVAKKAFEKAPSICRMQSCSKCKVYNKAISPVWH